MIVRSAGSTPERELFVFNHARESRSPAGTGQNAGGERKGVQGLFSQYRFSNQHKQTSSGAEHRDPGTQDPPSYLSATAPACQEARATGGPRACTGTLMGGKRRDGTGPPKQPKGKEKRRTGHLPGKGGSKLLRRPTAAPSGSLSLSPCLNEQSPLGRGGDSTAPPSPA